MTTPTKPTNENGDAVLSFWFEETKPYQWFRRDRNFDAAVRDRFEGLHAAAAAGDLDVWQAHPVYALSLIIILDQFSRNLFRDTALAFAHDAKALACARQARARRFDRLVNDQRRAFYFMPYMHAEDLRVQEECVAIFKAQLPTTMNVPFAIEHRDIVKRFGRFPHRNKVYGRRSTPQEIAFLKAGGFNP